MPALPEWKEIRETHSYVVPNGIQKVIFGWIAEGPGTSWHVYVPTAGISMMPVTTIDDGKKIIEAEYIKA